MRSHWPEVKAILLVFSCVLGLSPEAWAEQSTVAAHASSGFSGAATRHTESRLAREVASGEERPRAHAPSRKDATGGQWRLIGPQPLIGPDGKSYTGTMAHSGLINAVAVDPRNSNVVYLGAAGGGVWKTTDGGQTWIPLTDDQASLQIGALALDPTNPDILYAGTHASDFFLGNMGAGIVKSSDGGATWTQLPGPLPIGPGLEASIWSLAVSPGDGDVLLAVDQSASGAAVYRSADGGNTWTQVIAPNTAFDGQVLFDPSNGSIAYATLGGVYKSTDGGNTWANANGTGSNVLPAGTTFFGLGIAPSSPQTVFVGNFDYTGVQIFKSVDGGENWTPLPGSPAGEGIQVDPVNPNIIFAASGGVYRSTDGGLTWTLLYAAASPHTGIAFSADGSRLYLGGEWGIWVASDLTNSNLTLKDLNNTLAITNFFGIAIHPADPAISFAGTASNGVDMYSGAMAWQWRTCDNGGQDAAFDFMNPNTIYITCAAAPGVQKSVDGGATLFDSQNGVDPNEFQPGASPALAMDPANPQRLYLASVHVWQTKDGANTWTAISPALGPGTGFTQTLAVAQSDPNTVYLGNSNGVYVATNAVAGAGAIWTSVSAGLPSLACTDFAPTCSYLSQIAADPSNPGTAYATFATYVSGHVYKTTDRGANWTDISGDLPNHKVNDIAVDPDVPDTLYIATERGVYSTVDGGSTWSPLGVGLPNVTVAAIKLHRPTRILRAATYGRSVWDLQLAMVASPVTLSTTSLSFANQAAAQTVTLTNNGTTPLALYSVTSPSGFLQSNTCGIQLRAKSSCTLTVSFVPTESGTFSGNITITDDAPGSPQLIAVTGTGSAVRDFYLVSGSSSSAIVAPGQTVRYAVGVIPQGGFNQAVSLACTGAPSQATCSVRPQSVTLDGKNPAAATVTVTTTAPSLVMRGPLNTRTRSSFKVSPVVYVCALALLASLFALGLSGRDRRVPVLARFGLGLMILLATVWVACGGGGTSGGGGGGGNPGTPIGTYTLTVTGTSSSGSTALNHEVTLTLTVN